MKKKRLVIMGASILILLISLIVFYLRPVSLKFEEPITDSYNFFAYASESNESSGITMTKHELSLEDYLEIVDVLNHASLQRTFIGDKSFGGKYAPLDLRATCIDVEHDKVYLSELRLYSKDETNYVVAYVDGKEQIYRIIDENIVDELISLIESVVKD